MAIKLHCPRCKKSLAAPNKKAGSYVNCPSCSGRLWVPRDALADATHLEAVVAQGSSPGAVPPASTPASVPPGQTPLPPPASPGTIAKVMSAPAAVGNAGRQAGSAPLPGASTPMPAVGPRLPWQPPLAGAAAGAPGAPQVPSGPKVARFISAEATRSTLKLAEDGQLPELHLRDGDQQEKTGDKSKSVHPLVLIGALSLSVLLSIAMVLMDTGPQSASKAQLRAEARQLIEENYFGRTQSKTPLEPYQELLREAQREHDRGDDKAAQKLYREVLKLLRAERLPTEGGLTGSQTRDEKLKEQINVLLDDR